MTRRDVEVRDEADLGDPDGLADPPLALAAAAEHECPLLTEPEVTLLEMVVMPGEALRIPTRNASIFSGSGIVAWRSVGGVLAGALCNCQWTENPDQATNSNESSHGG